MLSILYMQSFQLLLSEEAFPGLMRCITPQNYVHALFIPARIVVDDITFEKLRLLDKSGPAFYTKGSKASWKRWHLITGPTHTEAALLNSKSQFCDMYFWVGVMAPLLPWHDTFLQVLLPMNRAL